ncbi:MAG: adenosine deaminase [Chloroflexota bacterium]|jgi:adenosine deaminase
MHTEWLTSLPKVELHIHLEGAIPLPTLWQLVQQYGGDNEVTSVADLEKRFAYRDFPHFIDTWVWKNRFIRTYADFTLIAEAVARDLANQNIRYVESHYSPTDFARHGLEIGEITRAIRTGLDRVPEITFRLIADVVRDSPIERAMRTVETVAELKEYGVIGIGLGGSEQLHPPGPFAPVFDRARQLGLRTTAHAGEAAGADSIWGALRDLKAERIGHAARANEDHALVDYMTSHRIPLEMCPISNLRTGVYGDIGQHPVGEFIARGMLVTINTDDPKMFNNTMVDEYALLMERFGLTQPHVCTLIDNAITASWLDDAAQTTLRRTFHADPKWIH